MKGEARPAGWHKGAKAMKPAHEGVSVSLIRLR